MRRRRPDTLYELWFYVTVPGTGFETPRVRRRVGFRASPSGGDRVTPFLTVDYSVGMLLDDELTLSGRADRATDDDDEAWNYTVRALDNQTRAHRSHSAPPPAGILGDAGAVSKRPPYRI